MFLELYQSVVDTLFRFLNLPNRLNDRIHLELLIISLE